MNTYTLEVFDPQRGAWLLVDFVASTEVRAQNMALEAGYLLG